MVELRSPNNDRMILEGMVSTTSVSGVAHFSPMGPDVDRLQTSLVLKPFCTSTTYGNLERSGLGVFHVIDDVEMLVAGAIGQWTDPPTHHYDEALGGFVLDGACRALAFRVDEMIVEGPRATISCQITAQKTLRECFGWNRAQHAVLELAILATRLHLLERKVIVDEISRLAPLIEKTGGDRERTAWAKLVDYVS